MDSNIVRVAESLHLSASSASPMGSPLKVMFMTEYHDAMRPLNRLNDTVINRASRLLEGR